MNYEELNNEILSHYDNALNANQISKIVNKSFWYIKKVLIANRNPTFKKYYNGNMKYFENIDTDSKAYFLGFIAADGCICDSRSTKGLTITINIKDRMILDSFKKELCSENPVKELKNNNLIRFVIYNKELTDSLAKYEILPRKSLLMSNIIVHIPKEFKYAFIRGYFDGDGSFSFDEKRKRGTIAIRGTNEFLLGIINTLNINTYCFKQYDSIPNLSISAKKNIKKFFELIYQNSTIHLDRKYNKLKLFVDTLCQDQTISSPSI